MNADESQLEPPVDTTPSGRIVPEIPHLDVAAYGNQETFLTMLESILNTTIDVVNLLAEREAQRERQTTAIEIVRPRLRL